MKDMDLNYRFIDASKEYYKSLKDIEDPEKKRKIIGEKFIKLFENVAEKEKIEYLIQGTIAPDWIESGDELRDTIKSHHNVGGLPKNMKLKLVEPLRNLYKDEVRKVARELKLSISEKQPFPGPGLAVRIIGKSLLCLIEILKNLGIEKIVLNENILLKIKMLEIFGLKEEISLLNDNCN